MAEQNYLVRFSKTENARFLSHLDMARTFFRAMRRARFPLKYSEGFHAHPKMRFSPPLSVGVESLCEYCRVTLIDETRAPDVLKAALQEAMPDSFAILSVAPEDAKPPMPEFASYEIRFSGDCAERLAEALQAPLDAVKRTKTKEITLDLAPLIKFSPPEFDGKDTRLTVTLPAAETLNINPNLLLSALNAKMHFGVKRIIKLS